MITEETLALVVLGNSIVACLAFVAGLILGGRR